MSPRGGGRPSRSVGRGAVKRQLLVFVEGRRTEDDYLTYWRRLHRRDVAVTIADQQGTPKTLVAAAVAEQRASAKDARNRRGVAWDEIWCVFDVDEHPALHEAIEQARANGIGLAISNPCVELWFVLHFEDQTAYIDRRHAQSRSKDLLGCDKALTDDALELLADRYDDAVARAVALDRKHEGDGSPPGHNPSSQIWRLVERIRGAALS